MRKLQKFGLPEKEAKVYLVVLELCPNLVQKIATKVGINRATAYAMVKLLTKRANEFI